MTRNQIIIIGAGALVIISLALAFIFFGSGGSGGGFTIGGEKQIELSFWGVEDEFVIKKMIESYSAVNPTARITYRQFSKNDYEKNLINALASGNAPDIFIFNSGWLWKHYDKIAPLKELPITKFREMFPSVTERDFTANGAVYALPLYIDTLALIYNKDFFDAKGIALPPKTWEEFQAIVPRLRETDINGRLIKAGAAIGGSGKSVNTASDILNLLMLQSGVKMAEQSGEANFSKTGGLEAFEFYLSFGNPSNRHYAWNDGFLFSIDGFSQENTALIFDYADSIKTIKTKNPFLNIGVSAMPQFLNAKQPVDYADYWGLTVSSQSKNYAVAWHFNQYLSTAEQFAEEYLALSGRPPALRTLIQKYSNDENLGVFANQALTARSWPKPDKEEVKKIFSGAIESVLNGRLSPQEALQEAENRINSL